MSSPASPPTPSRMRSTPASSPPRCNESGGAAAVDHYLKRRDGAEPAAREALDIRLRAERFVGEKLAADPAIRRGRSKLRPVTLPDGVSKMQSHCYQYFASVPDDIFEEELAKPDLSTTKLVRLLQRRKKLAELEDIAARGS